MASPQPVHTYPPLSQHAINLALSEMPLLEFEAWQLFTSPPPRSEIISLETITLEAPMDWDKTASVASPFNEDTIAIAGRRIKGLNYLYNTSKARLIHADWYATKYAGTWLPVVEAVGRVLTWENSLKNGAVSDSVIAERSISTILTEEIQDATSNDMIPVSWKSYNITSVPMPVIPPFDPLALKHALIELRGRRGRPSPEYQAYLAFTAGTITASTLKRDCPIDWDTDFTKTKLGRNVHHDRDRTRNNRKRTVGGRRRHMSTLTLMKRKAEVLSFLYQSEKVTPAHAFWWKSRYGDTQGGSLVLAVEKICETERVMDVRPALW